MCTYVWHSCAYTYLHVCAHACGDPRLTLGVFLDQSPLYTFWQGPPLNPKLSALAIVAHQLAPGIPCVGLPLTVATGGLFHFCLAFYLALGIRTPLTFTSVWPLLGPVPYTFEGAYGSSSALFPSSLASSKTYRNRQPHKINAFLSLDFCF